ncbi:homocysteine S-methyltransferase family protein [Chelatococcus reniformis]|uniref:Homocysteine S-methyltransferase n=1 Tax=Chelatococcus reniformis TaxID=1494448 RepID=A0A916XEM3_9HYPH|nr:homocysteine S-methyltransferase family protein [Chelatococcus reniformis]GGC64793.1 homocysteine S-methyltransferase [Chelatococcus reniformis]
MPRFRHALPQLAARPFLTDGGLETTLVFDEKLELPCFAAFPLIMSPRGRALLWRCYQPYIALAARYDAGLILDTPTWRANPDWGAALGYSGDQLRAANGDAVDFIAALREASGRADAIVLNGVIGPRGDGYKVGDAMSAKDAAGYHAPQIKAFSDSETDMVSAVTLTYAQEAIGVALAAREAAMPIVISFTVETDGHLPSGESIAGAIEATDDATGAYPAYYMINCAHPLHFEGQLMGDEPWMGRVRGIRANASTRSHAELDAATELDIGDPRALGAHYAGLRRRHPHLTVLGGCCGTDHRHIAAICEACL